LFCPACRKFSRDLDSIIKTGQGKYHIVFKHFPLGTACNHALKTNMHPLACEAAWAAEAAHNQGKFWAFHDIMFANAQKQDPKIFYAIAQKLGLNIPSFDQYRRGDAAKENIQENITLGIQLGITGTPTVFLNGKLVNDLRPGILQVIINEEQKQLRLHDTVSMMHVERKGAIDTNFIVKH
jgi:protein-disulfide isomerase